MDVSSENKLKYETVVFDLDGVIIDSSWDIADAVNGILEIYDCKTRDYNFIKKSIGGGAKNILLQCLEEDKKPLIDEILVRYKELYFDNCTKKTTLYPGVMEVLQSLAGKVNIALATFKVRGATEKILEELGVKEYFDVIVTSDDVTHPKPNPECILKILEESQSRKETTILVGDTPIDVFTGKNAGVTTCAVLYGFGNPEEIRKAKPDYIIEDIRSLLEIILDTKLGL
ncbi:MAG TPA: HAD family hydrolase [Thermoanaerobacterales bacterium]|nr:HAD family hydrolase [Thermoanaerobacterales bacterium]